MQFAKTKRTASIYGMANNNLLELQWLLQECGQYLYNNNTP